MDDYLYVIGHKNPDSDSICSALAYAELKRQLGEKAIACRLGPLNDETKFILNRFNMENPLLLKDARSQIRDIDMDTPNLINENSSLHEAWDRISGTSNRSLFVLNDKEELVGIVSTSNLSLIRMLSNEELYDLMATSSLESIAKTISADIIYNPPTFSSNGKVFVVTLTETSNYHQEFKNSICILSDGFNKQKELILSGVKCLVITCDQWVDEEIIKLAKDNCCAILKTKLDTMAVATVINESFSIKQIMTKSILSFYEDEYVNDVASKMMKSRVRSYPVLDIEGKVVGAISRYHMQNYKRKKFVLVDHSVKNQAIKNIMDASIEEIIDHHHIGDIQTEKPIFYRNMKCGCTATIVALLYQENGIIPSKDISGVLLSAILSDTLNFKSATTTDLDKNIAKWLAQRAEIENIDEYATEMLSASVSLLERSPHELLNRDLKHYEMGEYSIAVAQTNYVNMADVQQILPEFKKNMEKEQADKKVDLLVMLFTHVLAEGSLVLFYGPLSHVMKDLIEQKFDENSGYDQNIISRKQQLIPKLSMAIKML
ncbi:MAG: putative manganese-dependent inorganic diphosphatase [Erysipelotrichaceae bacterium]|nr:putative manganese-dependent inorganic diphosphatase [Erysipelotrichaceae bacterium]